MEKEYLLKENSDGSKIYVNDVHAILLTMLKDIDAICKKYDIPYYLSGGTCLGAIRHQGFIPWDDDADIAMLYEDYVRFLEALKKELPNDQYYYQCFDTHKEYNVLIPSMKFRKKNTYIKEANTLLRNKCKDGDGIFIDVFVIDHISEKKWIDFSSRILTLIMMVIIVFFENIRMNPLFLKKLFMRFVRFYGRKNKNSPLIGYDLCWLYNSPLKPIVYRKDEIFPLQYQPFEDTKLLVPKNPDALLKVEIGGDYMDFPKKKMQAPKHIVDIDLSRKD